MEDFRPSDLKTILHSKRAQIYYLEHCRVLVNGGRVEYVTEEPNRAKYWNIPIANTTSILLGTGTSVTQAAMRELARAGVMVGFCGGGGTPLFSGGECDIEVSWILPQSEYRPTEYLQGWIAIWMDEVKRLVAAKMLQEVRLGLVLRLWRKGVGSGDRVFAPDVLKLERMHRDALDAMRACQDTGTLLSREGEFSKKLYALVANGTDYGGFKRGKRGSGVDAANRFLDHGNYLAYGLAATATWVLGLPHGLSVLHGKTRRGGLVFDVADIVKDAVVMPQAFLSAMEGDDEQEFRGKLIARFLETECLDLMIATLQSIAKPQVGTDS